MNQYNKEYREKYKDELNERARQYALTHKEHKKQYDLEYNEKNREKKKKQHKEYYQNNKGVINEKLKEKYKTDIQYKISLNLRRRIIKLVRRNQKAGSAVKDLGCSTEELKVYLENKFYCHPKTGEPMTWDNWTIDGWHIDHIIPLSSFDLTNKEQFLKACHYTNLQPLWAEENLEKSNKI
jgi:hypothetical protein